MGKLDPEKIMTNPHEEHAVPEAWIRSYVDTLLEFAGKADGSMRNAAALRADHAMDLVAAWREAKKCGWPHEKSSCR